MITAAAKVTAPMVSSLDRYIAKKDGSVSWIETSDTYEQGVSREGTEDIIATVELWYEVRKR